MEIVFRSLWTFIVTAILFSMVLKFLLVGWCRTLRIISIWKHGWPEAPIDADGDVVYPEKEVIEDQDIHSKS